MKKMRGFTLVELMIVLAVIGILAAIALPAYADYTKRTHVAEGLVLTNTVKAGVMNYWAYHGSYPADNASAGLPNASDISGNAVSGVETAAGVITVSFNDKVDSGATLLLTASATDGSLVWDCARGGSMKAYWAPPSCR
jgi:type IV pilus assembly protein PilA